MRRFWPLAIALLILAPGAALPQMLQGIVAAPKGAAAGYTGPGDIAPATAWWGLRCYSAAVAATGTQKAIQLKRASDSTTQDILCLATGDLDVATATTFCNATTCTMSMAYDQASATWDLTTASGPPFNFANLGTHPTVGSATAVAWTTPVSASFTPASGVLTLSLVARRDGATSSTISMVRIGNGSNILKTPTTGTTWVIDAGQSGAAASGVWHAGNGAINGASSALMIDGTDNTGTTSTGSTGVGPMQAFAVSALYGLRYVEAGVWDGLALDATTRGNIDANQRAYWGF